MPYARFISKWFAHVPNINLGIMQAYLSGKGRSVRTFHFHLDFLPYLRGLRPHITDNLLKLTEQFGVEYLGLDYLFASLLFEDKYRMSKERFEQRLESLGMTLKEFEELREVAAAFLDSSFQKLSPHLEGTKLIGFSSSHYQLSSSLMMCARIKKHYPEIKTVIGGKDCSGAFGYDLLAHADYVDYIGTGECEVAVESILVHIGDERNVLYNVICKDPGGNITKTSYSPNISLNSLPFPQYPFEEFPVELSEIILPVEFGRGCPWKRCTFCPDESYNITCQTKTAGRLKDEFAYYQNISGDLRNFFILDSDALKDPQLIIDISHYLEGKNFNFIYAEFRADRMNRDVLASILRFGTWTSNFQIGIETFSERILQLMNKGVTALKNVEVLKAIAELKVPVQFNLFTCFPMMSEHDMKENLWVMERITHILVSENIQIFPGEFYLPTDCPVYLNSESYGIRKHGASIFSLIFEDFSMPSYSNYPYPYEFSNDDEQYRMSGTIRNAVEEIKSKNPAENYMVFRETSGGFQIETNRDGKVHTRLLSPLEGRVYLSAVEVSQEIVRVSETLGLPLHEVESVLDSFERDGLILYSHDRKLFLSLATRDRTAEKHEMASSHLLC